MYDNEQEVVVIRVERCTLKYKMVVDVAIEGCPLLCKQLFSGAWYEWIPFLANHPNGVFKGRNAFSGGVMIDFLARDTRLRFH